MCNLRSSAAVAVVLSLVAAQASAQWAGRGYGGRGYNGARGNYYYQRGETFGTDVKVIDDRPLNPGETVGRGENRTTGAPATNRAAEQFRRNMERTASNLQNLYRSDNEPFSAGWYLDHPNAWQVTNPYGNAFKSSTAATIGAWLGMNAVGGGNEGDVYANRSAKIPSIVSDDADNVDLPEGEWLPMGVFAMGAGNQTESNTLIQISIDRAGEVRGTYYDILSNEAQDIRGYVNKNERIVSFNIGNNSEVTFEAGIDQLAGQAAPVTVRFPGGQWQWQLVKLEK